MQGNFGNRDGTAKTGTYGTKRSVKIAFLPTKVNTEYSVFFAEGIHLPMTEKLGDRLNIRVHV